MFDYDDSVNLAYNAKMAGKNLVAAKHELLSKTGDFLFLAHSDREFAMRCQFVEEDIEKIAHRKLATISDSKAKLVRAAFDEWNLRHASCEMCKVAVNAPGTPFSNSEARKRAEEASKCQGPNCNKAALANSKFCGAKCMEDAKTRVEVAPRSQKTFIVNPSSSQSDN